MLFDRLRQPHDRSGRCGLDAYSPSESAPLRQKRYWA
jgi:hypothetical protein